MFSFQPEKSQINVNLLLLLVAINHYKKGDKVEEKSDRGHSGLTLKGFEGFMGKIGTKILI